jgi:hypothetical protein
MRKLITRFSSFPKGPGRTPGALVTHNGRVHSAALALLTGPFTGQGSGPTHVSTSRCELYRNLQGVDIGALVTHSRRLHSAALALLTTGPFTGQGSEPTQVWTSSCELYSNLQGNDIGTLVTHNGRLHSAALARQWVPGVIYPGIKRGRGVMLTTQPHPVPRLRMSKSYTCSPHKGPSWRVAGQQKELPQ